MNREKYLDFYIMSNLKHTSIKLDSFEIDKMSIEEKQEVYKLLNEIGKKVSKKELL